MDKCITCNSELILQEDGTYYCKNCNRYLKKVFGCLTIINKEK